MTTYGVKTREEALAALQAGEVLDDDELGLLPRATLIRAWWHRLLGHRVEEELRRGQVIAFGLFVRSWDTTGLYVCSCGKAWTRWLNSGPPV